MPNKEPKYIDADALVNFVRSVRHKLPKESKDFFTRDEMLLNFEQYCNHIPPAPVRQEVHAAWTQEDYYDEDNGVYTCSNCKEAFVLMEGTPEQNLYDYCPKCGSRMDLDAKGE